MNTRLALLQLEKIQTLAEDLREKFPEGRHYSPAFDSLQEAIDKLNEAIDLLPLSEEDNDDESE